LAQRGPTKKRERGGGLSRRVKDLYSQQNYSTKKPSLQETGKRNANTLGRGSLYAEALNRTREFLRNGKGDEKSVQQRYSPKKKKALGNKNPLNRASGGKLPKSVLKHLAVKKKKQQRKDEKIRHGKGVVPANLNIMGHAPPPECSGKGDRSGGIADPEFNQTRRCYKQLRRRGPPAKPQEEQGGSL